MKRDGIVLVRSIYRANKCADKESDLERFMDDFEILKLEVRFCVDLKVLSMKKPARLAALMEYREADNRPAQRRSEDVGILSARPSGASKV